MPTDTVDAPPVATPDEVVKFEHYAPIWQQAERVPMSDIARVTGATRPYFSQLREQGLLPALPERGPHGLYYVTGEQATRVLAAFALAAVIGIGVITALRAIQAGAQIGPNGVTINFTTT